MAWPASGQARRSLESECEAFALADSKRGGGGYKSVKIVREAFPTIDRIDKKIGAVEMGTEYIGRAEFVTESDRRMSSFVCVLGGKAGKPVYFVEVPTRP